MANQQVIDYGLIGDERRQEVVKQLAPVDAWIVHAIDDIHTGCKQVCAEAHENARKHWSQYLGDKDAPTSEAYQGNARLYPNKTADIVDSIHAKILSMLFPSNTEFFGVLGRTTRSILKEVWVRDWLEHHFERMKMFLRSSEWLLHCCVAGTGIGELGWEYEVAKVEQLPRKNEGMGAGALRNLLKVLSKFDGKVRDEVEVTTEWEVIADHATFTNIPLEDFFVPDLEVERLDDLDYCGKQFWKTRREIQQDRVQVVEDPATRQPMRVGTYRNANLVPKQPNRFKEGDENTSGSGDDDIRGGYHYGELPVTQSIHNVEYHFRDIRALFDGIPEGRNWRSHLRNAWDFRPKDLEGGAVVTVSDCCVPIRIEPMADPTGKLSSVYVVQKYKSRKKSLLGKGIPEKFRSEQIELSATRNQIMDGTSKQLRRRQFIDKALQMERGKLKRREHDQQIWVDNNTGGRLSDMIQYEDVPAVPGDAYQHAIQLESDMMDRAHSQDWMRGRPSGKRMSATETSEVSAGAELVSTQEVRHFEADGLVSVIEGTYKNARRRLTRPTAIRITGQAGAEVKEIEPAEIWGDFDFYLKGAREMSNRFLRLNALSRMAENPVMAPFLNMAEIARRQAILNGEPDPDALVIDPNKAVRMMDIQKQWSVFFQGEYVEVTGRETLDEHKRAIEAHEIIFLGLILPQLEQAGAEPHRILRIREAAERCIADHEHYAQKKMEQQAQMEAAAMAGGSGGGGKGGAGVLDMMPGEDQRDPMTQNLAGAGAPSPTPN